jgi:hypothetical protein
MYIYIYTYTHIYIYTHINTHIHTYIHTYTSLPSTRGNQKGARPRCLGSEQQFLTDQADQDGTLSGCTPRWQGQADCEERCGRREGEAGGNELRDLP